MEFTLGIGVVAVLFVWWVRALPGGVNADEKLLGVIAANGERFHSGR